MSEEKKEKITENCTNIDENKDFSFDNEKNNPESKKECFIKVFKEKHPYIFLTIIGAIIILFSVIFDQVTKVIANNLRPYQVDFIPYIIRFTYTTNTGAAWGLFGESEAGRIILIIISWAVAIGLIGYFIYLVYKKENIKLGLFIICAFIVGGDIGNLIDRTFFYERGVIDFLDITSWWPGFGIFNIADSILVCSIVALIIYFIVVAIKESRWYRTRVAEKEKDDSNKN